MKQHNLSAAIGLSISTLLLCAAAGAQELPQEIEVVGTTPGAGLGLVGLTERAELRGGHLSSGRDGSTFVLHAWIPWGA